MSDVLNGTQIQVPRKDPIHNAGSDKEFREAMKSKMKPCGVVIVLAGVYATYSKWITQEIKLAERGFSHPKPVIAVRPRGNSRISMPVKEAAIIVVG